MKHPHTPVEAPPHSPPARRTKSTGSTTTSSSSTVSHHRGRSLSTIPFSWEKHPGIAKQTNNNSSYPITFSSPLPPPPPMAKKIFKIPSATDPSDPFEVALNECARDPGTPPGLMEEIWGDKEIVRRKRSWRYGTCKAAWACSVLDSTVRAPRTGVQTAGFRLLNQRIA